MHGSYIMKFSSRIDPALSRSNDGALNLFVVRWSPVADRAAANNIHAGYIAWRDLPRFCVPAKSMGQVSPDAGIEPVPAVAAY